MGYYKCWICKDQGMIILDRKHNGLVYEMAARCSCIKGQELGERIPMISQGKAIILAETNYGRYKAKVV